MGSLFEAIPKQLPQELFDTLYSTTDVKIERIVSRGHVSPEGFWYDQERNEFVLLVKGRAGLRFKGETDIVVLNAEEYNNIDAHVKHRVEWTDSTCDTIWLTVHYR